MVTPWVAYYEKAANLKSRPERARFWDEILRTTEPGSVLEVGCGDGLNLEHIDVPYVVGVDSYQPALDLAEQRFPKERIRRPYFLNRDARDLDLLPQSVDLVFTCTTLQHITIDMECRRAIRELRRVSRKWVLVMEYSADVRTPVLWRGDPEGIVKRPWWDYMEKEGLVIVGTGMLRREDGFDDVSWYLAKK